jgi:RNA polymerase sigma-70 factor (ECF subfamily)
VSGSPVPRDEDAAAVERVRAGDVDAFAILVERWQRPLFRLALRYTSERGTAEDLCQEIFLRAFRSLARFRGDSRFSTWLIALAVNVCRSHARRLPPPALLEPAQAERVGDPASIECDALEPERVRRAVANLPARYRDALHVYYFHEQDVADAAASLGVPHGTLKARLSRGRKLLAALLGEPGA